MPDSMQYDPIQVQGHEPLKVRNPAIVLVFVSCDFELGRNCSCEESINHLLTAP